MRQVSIALALALMAVTPLHAKGGATGAQITAAVAAPDRPASDTARDDDRKPAGLLAFSEVKPGEAVADLLPGQGYFTRLFGKLVGPRGKVFAVIPGEMLVKRPKAADGLKAIAAEPGYGNIAVVTPSATKLDLPQAIDIAWTSQNYHDLYGYFGADQAAAFDRAVFAALRPGGLFIVVDHSAVGGTSATSPTTIHRIDEATVKAQVLAAGFVLVSESDILRNPADPRTAAVFAPEIRGHTDQFVLKFRKPG